MTKNNMKNKKRKIKPIPFLVTGVICLGIVAGTVFIIWNRPKTETVDINVTDLGEEKNESESGQSGADQVTVSIDMESCAIPIGTTLKVTATVEPVQSEEGIVWSSSDESIFVVDAKGIITIKGKGSAALTATVGKTSNGIVIEGIENRDSAKSELNLPVFNLVAKGETSNLGSPNSGNLTSDTSASSGNSGISNGNTGNTSSGNTSSGNTSSGNTSIGSDSSTGSGSSSGSPSSEGTGSNGTTTPGNGTTKGMTSTEIGGTILASGFNSVVSNVFVYEENGTYCGEIIIQSNATIFYIKERTTGFDTRIQEVLKSLLPLEGNTVWSNYLSAGSDRTFMAEERMVRIVTAKKGGHSQIVIYN